MKDILQWITTYLLGVEVAKELVIAKKNILIQNV